MNGPDHLRHVIARQKIDATLIDGIGDTPTVSHAAIALGVPVDDIIKTLLFEIDLPTGDASLHKRIRFVAVLAAGERRVDKQALAAYFGVGKKRVNMAGAGAVVRLLGYAPGGVAPIGHAEPVKLLIDAELANRAPDDIVYPGGGDHATMMRISIAELLRVTQAEVLALSQRVARE